MKSVFIYVQHLLGTGHLRRMEALADALAGRGLAVTLVSGGVDPPQCRSAKVTTVMLPAIKTDAGFSGLFQADGAVVTAAFKDRRKRRLLELFAAAPWHALLVEMYPFGRRRLRFELLPLLAAAGRRKQAGPPITVCSSVRDLLQGGRSAARNREICELVETYFDYVLVHSDRARIPFDLSFPLAARIQARIVHTGYVTRAFAPAAAPSRRRRKPECCPGGGLARRPGQRLG